ncbi:MAG: tripartite tricarboxylate transporter substrate-binding protein [Burkholderiales bacterium]|nr:tripartite tricarboxylate transporter substrate-binding protein [Burkholderiales bacterium]
MRNALRGLLACLLAAVAATGVAQEWPTRTVHFIVPYPAGGYYDLLARVIGQKLNERLGQSFVVENRVGANGMIGTDYVAKSAPDGYTIMMGASDRTASIRACMRSCRTARRGTSRPSCTSPRRRTCSSCILRFKRAA